jgi:predicted esterase
VTLRVPRGYDTGRPWPLIYALHGSGGDAESIVAYVEKVLGDDVDSFVIAAPSDYEQFAIQAQAPPTREHLDVLLAVKKACRIDSDRVYLTGYSRGGHGSWTVGILYADQFAGIIPVAGTLVLPEADRLWDAFLPNVSSTHVLNVWGADDRLMDDGRTLALDGGIAGLNRKLRSVVQRLELPVESIEDPERGHGGVAPPLPELRRMLSRRRIAFPPRVEHAFRAECQASAYWLEGREWTGRAWGDDAINVEMKENEEPGEAIARAIRARLGRIEGAVEGNTVTVKRKNLKELMVWFQDGMVDWSRPVVIRAGGRVAFEGTIEPRLSVCLREIARTYDFQRLRWAAVRIRSGKGEVAAD